MCSHLQQKTFDFHWHILLTFESLNRLNLLLQGKNTNRINNYDIIHAFIAKLRLWHRRVYKGDAASFPNLVAALEKSEVDFEGQLKSEVESHLQLLKQEFEHYFPDLDDSEHTIWKMTRNPFLLNEDILSNSLQNEFLQLKCNSTANDNFKTTPFNNF